VTKRLVELFSQTHWRWPSSVLMGFCLTGFDLVSFPLTTKKNQNWFYLLDHFCGLFGEHVFGLTSRKPANLQHFFLMILFVVAFGFFGLYQIDRWRILLWVAFGIYVIFFGSEELLLFCTWPPWGTFEKYPSSIGHVWFEWVRSALDSMVGQFPLGL